MTLTRLDPQGRRIVDELGKMLRPYKKRNIDLVELVVEEARVVDERAHAVANRVGNNPVHLGLRVELIAVEGFGHLPIAELAWLRLGCGPAIGRCVRQRGAKLARQNSRRRADLSQAHAHHRRPAAPRQFQHPDVIVRLVGHRADFHDVGIECAQPAMDVVEVVGCLVEVVKTDNPLGLAQSRNGCGYVVFQIDVLCALGDRGPQQR